MFSFQSAQNHLHIKFICDRCETQNLLHHEMLFQDHVYLRDQATGGRAIAFLCFQCKHACMYTDPTELYLPGIGGSPPVSWRCFVISLWCEEPLCGVQLRVFAGRSADTTDTDLYNKAAEWHLGGLVCPKGHAVSLKRRPYILSLGWSPILISTRLPSAISLYPWSLPPLPLHLGFSGTCIESGDSAGSAANLDRIAKRDMISFLGNKAWLACLADCAAGCDLFPIHLP